MTPGTRLAQNPWKNLSKTIDFGGGGPGRPEIPPEIHPEIPRRAGTWPAAQTQGTVRTLSVLRP